ncbi:hypothetical protein D9619_000664 [Psilocybe cf. subviscida]|uniref:N-acetyltransferase domain-containing protein n=1 Tax=Psilocybe cf. subviscida TaxID=2480587 RepID=A0A8H5F331_9AGAR|nr:hypothetical protein D9619_000664 [Psilocybe cf. subviscida]
MIAAILKEIFGLLFKPMSEFSGYEKALQATDGYAVDVQPLKLSEIWTAANTWEKAMVGDPYMEYHLADGRPTPHKIQRIANAAMLALWIGDVPIFTAEGGASLSLNYNPMGRPKTRLGKLKHKLAMKIYVSTDGKKTKEQQKRWDECREKEDACFRKAIPPEEAKEMYIVGQMATDPQYQGRGLGSAVLQAMTALANKEHRACWLTSSNIANEAFYNSNGFFAMAQFTVGESNPSWHKKPVLVQIMVREPEGGRRVFEQTSSPSQSSPLIKADNRDVPLQFRF